MQGKAVQKVGTACAEVGKGSSVAEMERRPKWLKYEKAGGVVWERKQVQIMHL